MQRPRHCPAGLGAPLALRCAQLPTTSQAAAPHAASWHPAVSARPLHPPGWRPEGSLRQQVGEPPALLPLPLLPLLARPTQVAQRLLLALLLALPELPLPLLWVLLLP